MPPGVEPAEVGAVGSGQNRAYGGHERRGDTPPTKDGMDESAPGAAITVSEWVNGLELGVRYSGLYQRRDISAVDVGHKVGQQRSEPPTCMWVLALWLWVVASGRSLAGLAREPSATFGLALPGYASRLTAGCGLAQQRRDFP